MDNPLQTPEDYEFFLCTITEQFPAVRFSTVTFARIGATLARISGEIHINDAFKIVIRERIVYHRVPITIEWYGYEIWKNQEKLYWYDSQPHPNDPVLQISHPHHKHIPPDIKHNRIPAPEMSFNYPNIPFLIHEVENM